jgi:hypothetical protein
MSVRFEESLLAQAGPTVSSVSGMGSSSAGGAEASSRSGTLPGCPGVLRAVRAWCECGGRVVLLPVTAIALACDRQGVLWLPHLGAACADLPRGFRLLSAVLSSQRNREISQRSGCICTPSPRGLCPRLPSRVPPKVVYCKGMY